MSRHEHVHVQVAVHVCKGCACTVYVYVCTHKCVLCECIRVLCEYTGENVCRHRPVCTFLRFPPFTSRSVLCLLLVFTLSPWHYPCSKPKGQFNNRLKVCAEQFVTAFTSKLFFVEDYSTIRARTIHNPFLFC